jgi:hypothetical protein
MKAFPRLLMFLVLSPSGGGATRVENHRTIAGRHGPPGCIRAGVTDPVELKSGAKTVTGQFAVVDVPADVRMDVDGVFGWGPSVR